MGEFYILVGIVSEVIATIKVNMTDIWRLAYLISGSVFLVGGSILRRMK